MPTSRSISTTRALASRRPTLRCCRSDSATWLPTRAVGSSITFGCWNSIATLLPRIWLRRLDGIDSRSSSSRRASPPTTSASGGRRPITVNAVRLLPEPDSPTSATISPRSILRSMPSMAGAPGTSGKSTRRPRMSSRLLSFDTAAAGCSCFNTSVTMTSSAPVEGGRSGGNVPARQRDHRVVEVLLEHGQRLVDLAFLQQVADPPVFVHEVGPGVGRSQHPEAEPGLGDDRAEHPPQPLAAAGVDQGHVELEVEVADCSPVALRFCLLHQGDVLAEHLGRRSGGGLRDDRPEGCGLQ